MAGGRLLSQDGNAVKVVPRRRAEAREPLCPGPVPRVGASLDELGPSSPNDLAGKTDTLDGTL